MHRYYELGTTILYRSLLQAERHIARPRNVLFTRKGRGILPYGVQAGRRVRFSSTGISMYRERQTQVLAFAICRTREVCECLDEKHQGPTGDIGTEKKNGKNKKIWRKNVYFLRMELQKVRFHQNGKRL